MKINAENKPKNTFNELTNVGRIINRNKKILVKIPVDPLNPLDKLIPIQINGYKWIIKRGEAVNLPLGIVKILEESGYLD